MNKMRHEKFMAVALDQAKKALVLGELPIGAAVVLDDEVVAAAYCQDRANGFLAHAELAALLDAKFRRLTEPVTSID